MKAHTHPHKDKKLVVLARFLTDCFDRRERSAALCKSRPMCSFETHLGLPPSTIIVWKTAQLEHAKREGLCPNVCCMKPLGIRGNGGVQNESDDQIARYCLSCQAVINAYLEQTDDETEDEHNPVANIHLPRFPVCTFCGSVLELSRCPAFDYYLSPPSSPEFIPTCKK